MAGRNVSRTVRSAMVPAGPGMAAAAAITVRRYLRRTLLPPDAAARLAIVVEELVINLGEHAELPTGSHVAVRLQRRRGGTEVMIVDRGTPFDPRLAAEPDALPPDRGGGAGLALVRAWTRIDDYRHDDGINRLRLWLPDRQSVEPGA